MPKEDIVLATAIASGVATMSMGIVANYPVRAVAAPLASTIF